MNLINQRSASVTVLWLGKVKDFIDPITLDKNRNAWELEVEDGVGVGEFRRLFGHRLTNENRRRLISSGGISNTSFTKRAWREAWGRADTGRKLEDKQKKNKERVMDGVRD